MMKVKYLGKVDTLALEKGKVYDVISVEKGWYGVVDETNEEYAYPPELFETIEE